MKNSRKRKLLNQSGIVLTWVMFLLVIMSIIIASVVFVTMSNLENSQKTASHIEVYYVAEGGLNYLSQSLSAELSTSDTKNFFSNLEIFVGKFKVKVLKEDEDTFEDTKRFFELWISPVEISSTVHSYKLFSKGYIGGISRTVSKIIKFTYQEGGTKFKHAILSTGIINLAGTDIKGTIQTTLNNKNAILFGKGSVNALEEQYAVYIPKNTDKREVVNFQDNDSIKYQDGLVGEEGIFQVDSPTVSTIKLETFNYPDTKTKLKIKPFTLNRRSYVLVDALGNLSITSKNNIDILTVYNIGNENPGQSVFYVPNLIISEKANNFTMEVNRDITLVVDKLVLKEQFKITGSGKLTIYVKPTDDEGDDKIEISADYQNENYKGIIGNNNDANKMIIYVGQLKYEDKKDNLTDVTLSLGSGKYYFSLICANLSIDLNDSDLKGAVATNGLNVSIGPSSDTSAILLYAPNATVTMKSGSPSFYGAIVAGSFTSPSGQSSPYIEYVSVGEYASNAITSVYESGSNPSIKIEKSPTTE